jgi:hypothetical protein
LQSLAGGGVNGFAGDVDVQAGILAFDTDELVDHAARLSVRAGATLALAGTETVSALTGDGILAIGGHVYVVPFEGDADCGISADKTYTHLLDFPANGNPATINGVTFVAAGMSGSSGDYTWSTVNPPTGTWNDPPTTAHARALIGYSGTSSTGLTNSRPRSRGLHRARLTSAASTSVTSITTRAVRPLPSRPVRIKWASFSTIPTAA